MSKFGTNWSASSKVEHKVPFLFFFFFFFYSQSHYNNDNYNNKTQKEEKKGKQTRKKKLVPTCKIYAKKLIIQLTIPTENDLLTQHYVH